MNKFVVAGLFSLLCCASYGATYDCANTINETQAPVVQKFTISYNDTAATVTLHKGFFSNPSFEIPIQMDSTLSNEHFRVYPIAVQDASAPLIIFFDGTCYGPGAFLGGWCSSHAFVTSSLDEFKSMNDVSNVPYYKCSLKSAN